MTSAPPGGVDEAPTAVGGGDDATTPPQDVLDAAIQSYYGDHVDEDTRITTRSVGGRVELERTRRLVGGRLTPGSRVLDVGGATGVHSRWLAEAGHDVTLIDPVPAQVERARAVGTFRAVVGDARDLPQNDGSVDAVLLLGPLYHLISRQDRSRALAEARRVLVPGGLLFAQGIGRLTAFAEAATRGGFEALGTTDLHILRTGEWASTAGGFPGGHFHTVAELRAEVEGAGFVDVEVYGVEGPHVGTLELVADDPELQELAVRLADRLDAVLTTGAGEDPARITAYRDAVAEVSPHLLAVARRG